LQPHRPERFKFSAAPDFETELADIAGLYLDAPEQALVLRVDEKFQIQALDRIAPLRPAIPARMLNPWSGPGPLNESHAASEMLDSFLRHDTGI